MFRIFFKILIFSAAAICFCISVNAQKDATTSNGEPRPDEPMPKGVLENIKKMETERSKKDYDDMLKNGEEAVKLSEEVDFSFEKNSKLSVEDFGKLERIEKLLKKIRSEMGGDGDEKKDDKKDEQDSLSVKNAVSSLKSSVINLYDELKKTSRFSISVAAVQSSNSLLSIVRFLRIRRK